MVSVDGQCHHPMRHSVVAFEFGHWQGDSDVVLCGAFGTQCVKRSHKKIHLAEVWHSVGLLEKIPYPDTVVVEGLEG